MYASMTHGNSMRDLCQRLNPQNLRINERRLVQFGLIEGLIRRVYNVSDSRACMLIAIFTLFHCNDTINPILSCSILYYSSLAHLVATKRKITRSTSILPVRIVSTKYVAEQVSPPRRSRISLSANRMS